MDGMQLKHVSEFKYLSCVLGKSGTDDAMCCRKVVSGRKVAGAIKFLANARGHWKEKERSRSEVCWVLGEWIMYQVDKLGSCVE